MVLLNNTYSHLSNALHLEMYIILGASLSSGRSCFEKCTPGHKMNVFR